MLFAYFIRATEIILYAYVNPIINGTNAINILGLLTLFAINIMKKSIIISVYVVFALTSCHQISGA